jgi:hypothetical protein
MKVGVPGFSYAGFTHFDEQLNREGFYTSNLGDNAQTIAARRAWKKVGVPDKEIITIDRDALKSYVGEPVTFLMNAVFGVKDLPAADPIIPFFMGFCADESTISMHQDWIRKHSPIGCRDTRTAEICRAYDIESFVSGCVTLTLEKRLCIPDKGKLFIVLGWDGLLPLEVLKHVPHDLLANAEFISHRKIESVLPLGDCERALNERYEEHLFRRYHDEAALVLTPLLHVGSPCTAMGIPVVMCRKHQDPRFGFMQSFLPLYGPGNLQTIDWSPEPPDVSAIAASYLSKLADARRIFG